VEGLQHRDLSRPLSPTHCSSLGLVRVGGEQVSLSLNPFSLESAHLPSESLWPFYLQL
jgi:hypothetical protein